MPSPADATRLRAGITGASVGPPGPGHWQTFRQLTTAPSNTPALDIERVVFRPRADPALHLPMSARSVGHRTIGAAHGIPRLRQNYHQFIWSVAGTGRVVIDGHKHTVGPGYVARYQSGDLQCYGAESERWEYRWWTMDGAQAATIVASFGLTWVSPRKVGACPHELFRRLEKEIKDVRPAAERRAAATVFALLAEVSGGEHAPHSQVIDEALGFIDRHHADPLFGIASLAAHLKVHRATLARNFTQQVGVSPMEYLVSVRVQRALALLKTTSLNITEIAYRSGFSDPNYFSRSSKRATGQTPSEFRAAGHA